jgi:hypothetical protein
VIALDPYNYFLHGNFISDTVKLRVINRNPKSMPRGNTLWKFIDFERHPRKNIIIGDSRAFDLDVSLIKKMTGRDYYNFGVPGGNYNSIIETFWYTAGISKPEKVYIQVSFHTYSKSSDYNLVADARKVYNSPYLFFTRGYFFQEAMLGACYSVCRIPEPGKEKLPFNESAWQQMLIKQVDSPLSVMSSPDEYYTELKKISDYCKTNDIELQFIIFPDQQDFHDLVKKHSLTDEYMNYKKDINSLGKTYDFDTPESDFTGDRRNYRDVYHLNTDLIDSCILPAVWHKKADMATGP